MPIKPIKSISITMRKERTNKIKMIKTDSFCYIVIAGWRSFINQFKPKL